MLKKRAGEVGDEGAAVSHGGTRNSKEDPFSNPAIQLGSVSTMVMVAGGNNVIL